VSHTPTFGHFAGGLPFDALLVDEGVAGSGCDVAKGQGQPLLLLLLLLLEAFLNNWDDRNIAGVYVQGRRCV
jgi:hypothetical protein